MKMGAIHPRTNSAPLVRPKHFKISDIAIVPIAVNKNTSEGIYIVCFSIALVVTSSFVDKLSIFFY
jgi:hypothetical protein